MSKNTVIILALLLVFAGYVVFEKLVLTTFLLINYDERFPVSQDIRLSFKPVEKKIEASENNNNNIFCIILTKPDNLRTKALTTLYVWATKCSNYKFVSVKPDYLSHPDNETILRDSPFNLLHPKGLVRENYTELTDKVFYAFRDIYEEFGNQYDWYMKADGKLSVYFEIL
jgi:hypothetical protein